MNRQSPQYRTPSFRECPACGEHVEAERTVEVRTMDVHDETDADALVPAATADGEVLEADALTFTTHTCVQFAPCGHTFDKERTDAASEVLEDLYHEQTSDETSSAMLEFLETAASDAIDQLAESRLPDERTPGLP